MQAVPSSQASRASAVLTCSQYVRPPSYQVPTIRLSGASFAYKLLPSRCFPSSRQHYVVRLAQREDFAEVLQKVKSTIPSVLKLQPAQPREANEVRTSTNTSDNASEGVSSEELPRPGSVGEVIRAAANSVAEANVQSVGQVALCGGMAAFALLTTGAVLNSVDRIPLAAELLQSVGVVYSFYVARQILGMKSVSFPPPSPFKAIIELVDGAQPAAVRWHTELQEELGGVAAVLESLSRERDTAVNQVEELRKTAKSIASVVAEKEAFEAVALHLADERDSAMSEVSALEEAIGAMTGRIKAIEEMLEREVWRLKEQNHALETVSLQLAAERDSAIQELRGIEDADSTSDGEKEALEMVAMELAQERDSARAEIEELKKVVTILREATATSSGLTPEQEVFIKARVRDIRSQFIDLEHVYDEQKEAVDRFVDHLIEEFGAPRDWTAEYIKQYLNSSATKFGPPSLSASQVEKLTTQTSRTSLRGWC